MNRVSFCGYGTLLLISHLPSEQQMVHSILSAYGYHIHNTTQGIEGFRLLFQLHPDLVLLDDSLPDISGEALWLCIRNFTEIPVIFLGTQPPAVLSHSLVNDEKAFYLARPLQPALLAARVKQALHVAEPQTQPMRAMGDQSTMSLMSELIVDHRHYQVVLGNRFSTLSAAEYQLLCYLLQNTNQLLSHQQLLKELWGVAAGNHVHQLHTLIWRLRRKIEQDPRQPKYLLSHYGVGYSFERQGIVEYNA
jgi:two-component system, OmpR family, KDP operon response regulator KdpE